MLSKAESDRRYYQKNKIRIAAKAKKYYEEVIRKRDGRMPMQEWIRKTAKPLPEWTTNFYDTPEKNARTLVLRAVRKGRLTKPTTCEKCLNTFSPKQLHGHHDDYSKWWAVRWLCFQCHVDAHPEHGAIRKASMIKNGTFGRNQFNT